MDWKDIAGKVAPVLATALGGPYALLAQQIISKALGLDKNASEKQLQEAARNDPEFALKLKQAEQDFTTKMEELGIKREEIAALDRDSARKREAAVGSKMNDRLVSLIAVLPIVITVGVFYLLLNNKFYTLSAMEASIVTLVIREAYDRLSQICNYYFGSSSGSARKTEIIGGK